MEEWKERQACLINTLRNEYSENTIILPTLTKRDISMKLESLKKYEERVCQRLFLAILSAPNVTLKIPKIPFELHVKRSENFGYPSRNESILKRFQNPILPIFGDQENIATTAFDPSILEYSLSKESFHKQEFLKICRFEQPIKGTLECSALDSLPLPILDKILIDCRMTSERFQISKMNYFKQSAEILVDCHVDLHLTVSLPTCNLEIKETLSKPFSRKSIPTLIVMTEWMFSSLPQIIMEMTHRGHSVVSRPSHSKHQYGWIYTSSCRFIITKSKGIPKAANSHAIFIMAPNETVSRAEMEEMAKSRLIVHFGFTARQVCDIVEAYLQPPTRIPSDEESSWERYLSKFTQSVYNPFTVNIYDPFESNLQTPLNK